MNKYKTLTETYTEYVTSQQVNTTRKYTKNCEI